MTWRKVSMGLVFGVAGVLAACGVPKEAGLVAAQGAAASATMPADDGSVREELKSQAAMWGELSALLKKREFGGIMGVDSTFSTLVDQTAALAQRQQDLISQNQDDAAHDRQTLQDLHTLWQSANKYLNQ
jgi:hypothetical protein